MIHAYRAMMKRLTPAITQGRALTGTLGQIERTAARAMPVMRRIAWSGGGQSIRGRPPIPYTHARAVPPGPPLSFFLWELRDERRLLAIQQEGPRGHPSRKALIGSTSVARRADRSMEVNTSSIPPGPSGERTS